MKRLRSLLAVLASLALTATLIALTGTPAVANSAAVQEAPKGRGTCTATTPGSAPKGRSAGWSCFKTGPAPKWVINRMARKAALAAPETRADDNDGAQEDARTVQELCLADGGSLVSNRLGYCIRGIAKYERWEAGALKGTAVVGIIIRSAVKETPKATWRERIEVQAVSVNDIPDGVAIGVSSTCSGICTTQGPAWGGSHVVMREAGTGAAGEINYSSPVSQGNVAPHIQTAYHIQGIIIGGAVDNPPKNDHWTGPSLRCDAEEWIPNPGCIVEGHMANVTIRKSVHGGAAITYEWAQKNLKNPTNDYGTREKPLHRDASGDHKKKSAITCDNAPRFVRDNFLVVDDNCDEYPFAKAEEGGKPGKMCVDIFPQKVGGVWDIANVKVMRKNDNAICVRSHVTGTENQKAGSTLGAATVSARILNREPYFVIIKD
ncbi:hypothetical protein OG897_31725 [Streptomyces sp. NBC_00237]|uniref:NucA/NucB deoxyribonuclease domain-containing protein n=1 Tax=Streptomyces sp. NBC_00237 TaxID=2975687 RepID=UPI00225B7D89|nr:hypothetical protein [Streptomyces sp. NBC_00237]MCX5205977.1 hypothetical protein [Streptomyces sp. NBC_00237]